jgi:hypothetical protein
MRRAEKALLRYHAVAMRRSNNSFNASGISMDVVRKIGGCLQMLPAALIRALGATFMRKIKGPTWRDMVIPLGMGGGAVAGLLVVIFMTGTGESEVRSPDDPGDALAMLGVFFMFAGAAIGTFIGVIAAIVLYLKRRRDMKLK